MSKLGIVNRFFFQFFFARLAKEVNKEKKVVGWLIVYFVVPFTGYAGKPFMFLGNPKHIRLK